MTSTLHPIGSHESNQLLDLVFVHGLGGHWLETWSHTKEKTGFWPRWVAQNNPDLAVWSLEYPAVRTAWLGANMSLLEHADDVLDCLRLSGIGARPVVFVCHSLGGLLVKQLLRTSAESNDAAISRIGEATAGVAFFATPNTGSRLASLAAISLAFLGPFGMAYRGSEVLRELRANSAQIRNLNDWFRNHAANRPTTERLHIKAWCEKLGPLGIRIVDETSANPGIADVTVLGVDADHFSISKPKSSEDRRILNVLEICTQPCAKSSNDRREEAAPRRPYRRRTVFIGRDREKQLLKERLAGGGQATICAVAGMGGVGKTELALQVAGELGEAAFPHGIVTVNLMGTPDAATMLPPLTPAAAMADVLLQLDPTAQPPVEPAALAQAYAKALVGKRLLLILDNARDTAQVTPLVPPEPTALVVTSRHHIDLPEGLTLDLDTLQPDNAVTLLREEIGAARVLDEATLARFAELCGYLPVALLAIAGAIRQSRARIPAQLLDRLEADRGKGLTGVLDRLRPSVDALAEDDPALARRFARLAVFAGDFSIEAAAHVFATDEDGACDSLDDLLARSLLLTAVTGTAEAPRFRLHDLIRELATERLGDDADAAALRHATFYRAVLSRSKELCKTGNDAVFDGLALFDRERAEIVAGQAWAAARAPIDDTAARLAALYPNVGIYVLALRLDSRTQILWLEAALDACRRLGDRRGEGVALGNLGLAWARLGEPRQAIAFYEQRLIIARELGDRGGEGNALGNLGNAWTALGEPRKAIAFCEQVLTIVREIGDRRYESNTLGNLGNAWAALGEPRKAIAFHEQALAISREIGDRRGEGDDLGCLGVARAALGEPRQAIDFYEQQLTIARELGDCRGEGNALWNMASAHEQLDENEIALDRAKVAYVIFRAIEHPDVPGDAAWLRERGVDPDSL